MQNTQKKKRGEEIAQGYACENVFFFLPQNKKKKQGKNQWIPIKNDVFLPYFILLGIYKQTTCWKKYIFSAPLKKKEASFFHFKKFSQKKFDQTWQKMAVMVTVRLYRSVLVKLWKSTMKSTSHIFFIYLLNQDLNLS